ncbi:MAG: Ribosomal protein S9 [Candidatus Parvarchaeum acidophilus ARMAN-5_'5-way FS']|jgi:large subunit ribosomal protein L13|uniref:50S ribosomal protein L13 n=2 Tax=Parvarchaeum acidophilus TaxID=662761 RepID=D6GW73_PARA5|nr:MAG: ribosomal protein L13 [Candidatus Parvarchaeum acidophilus ARMAN-5]EGD71869.1 MAG: Ribosomal protein S9 [Candidatus Parvarchaeum acidophilus ARMAN-5_'5-way FS']
MIIDGKDAVLGRIATFAAKSALEGEEVNIVNAGEIVIIGNKNSILHKYLERRRIGTMSKGPFFPRDTKGIVRRAVRGMIRDNRYHGREAFKRVKVFEDLPEEMKGKDMLEIAKARTDKPIHKIKIRELANILKQNREI